MNNKLHFYRKSRRTGNVHSDFVEKSSEKEQYYYARKEEYLIWGYSQNSNHDWKINVKSNKKLD